MRYFVVEKNVVLPEFTRGDFEKEWFASGVNFIEGLSELIRDTIPFSVIYRDNEPIVIRHR